MTRDEATQGALKIVVEHKLKMAVVFNPYSEEEASESWGYHPLATCHIFPLEEIIMEMGPDGDEGWKRL